MSAKVKVVDLGKVAKILGYGIEGVNASVPAEALHVYVVERTRTRSGSPMPEWAGDEESTWAVKMSYRPGPNGVDVAAYTACCVATDAAWWLGSQDESALAQIIEGRVFGVVDRIDVEREYRKACQAAATYMEASAESASATAASLRMAVSR